MYMILGIVMLLRGFADALMMRGQQMLAFGGSEGYLNAHHYDQVFTAHGVIMIFFVAMPLVTGLMNYVVPLQIGARDVSFPFLNNFSFWMTVGGAVLVMASLFIGEFARTGWLAYPPLSNIGYSPDVGVDYYIWALQIAGVGTTLSGINLICTNIQLAQLGGILFGQREDWGNQAEQGVFGTIGCAYNGLIKPQRPGIPATILGGLPFKADFLLVTNRD